MFARAILSWVMPDAENNLTRFLWTITEPVIYPVRVLLDKIPFLQEMPIDLSFIVTFLLLSIIQFILPRSI